VEEYLTVDELSARIKFSRQSLYNLIHKGTFVLGKHYLKPTPKKVLFKWSEILVWIGEPLSSEKESVSRSGYTADSVPLNQKTEHTVI
jgi:hypothetical protein